MRDFSNMPLGERLKQLRLEKKLSQSEVGKYIKKSKQMIGYYESGKNNPPLEITMKLAELFDIPISELLKVESVPIEHMKIFESYLPVWQQGHNEQKKQKQAIVYFKHLPDKDAELYIPYYDVEITAGKIELYFDDVEEVPEGYVYAPQYRGCIMCNVKGDSMYDRIFPGARLYVAHLPNKKYIDFGQIYLVVLDGYRLLKYIHRHPTDDTKIILSSHNKHYEDWDVEKADVLNLFIVKGYENQSAI